MTFAEILREYATTVGFSFKELSEVTGISVGTLSNYRTGRLVPKLGSPKLQKLAEGIAELSKKSPSPFTAGEVLSRLTQSLRGEIVVPVDVFLGNVRTLLRVLDIRNVELARGLNYDPSQISRFLSGERVPPDLGRFCTEIASFAASRSYDKAALASLQSLLQCKANEIDTPAKLRERLCLWLGSNSVAERPASIDSFLTKLDTFDLNDFIDAIHFNELKIPSLPFSMPTTKEYRGLAEFKQSELDFMKATALSKAESDLIVYSDMPIAEMGKDEEFAKKYMFGMAVLLKKGLHIHFIHDVHRPFDEMLLGLEAHIPMYMTGQISPYYFAEPQSRVFSHLLKVSGAAALFGQAVTNAHEQGLYVLTKSRPEVEQYQRAALEMRKCARPLMEVYRSDRREAFLTRLRSLWRAGSQRMIFSGLPLFTISDGLLENILRRSMKDEAAICRILAFKREYAAAMQELLKENRLTIEMASLTEEAFVKRPVALSLSELFWEKEILYTYDEYAAHLQETFAFANAEERCELKLVENSTFRNISFSILPGKCVVVSKAKNPSIHFVIYHPKLVKAFEMFIPPVRES